MAGISTTTLSVAEFSDYVDRIRQYAVQQFGIEAWPAADGQASPCARSTGEEHQVLARLHRPDAVLARAFDAPQRACAAN
jgi:hypothetical protein